MSYSLTIDGYTFDNPPEKYRKRLTLGNTPVPHFNKGLASFYQSDQQELQFEVEGRLSLNEQQDLDELERLQRIAIEGGAVDVEFDPFFTGECVIEDDPFRQESELGYYRFIMSVNSVSTDSSSYPGHATPTTGNTFKLGSFDFGYDPDTVEENYERQTATVDRLQGISQSQDNAGLVTKVTIDGNTDGAGQTALWDKARSNELSYLDAEFQNGWALIADLSVRNNDNAPDYLKGLFQYSLDLLIVSNPSGGIGEVSSFIDHDVKDTGTYVSGDDAGNSDFSGLEFTVNGGTGSINGEYVTWDTTTLTLSDDATNWLYADDSDGDGNGTVKYNNSGFPADPIKLYRVYTSNREIVKIEDVRAQLIKDNDSDAGDSSSEKEGDHIYYTVAGGTSPDDPNNQETTWVQTTVKLTLNSTNYMYVEDSDSDGTGTVSVNQSGYPSNTVSLWRVKTDGDSITNETDDRPGDLTEDGSGDTSNSDLVFSEDMNLDDRAFEFIRVIALSDSLDVGDAGTLPWLGIASFQGTLTDVNDADLLPATGIFPNKDTIQLSDGGSATGATGGGGGVDETVVWETTSDWDNAVSENNVKHLSDVVEQAYGLESWEDLSDGEGLPSPWNIDGSINPEADTGVSTPAGSVSMLGDPSGNSDAGRDKLGIYRDFSENPAPDRLSFLMRESSDSAGAIVAIFNENGNEIGIAGTSNPAWGYEFGSSGCFNSSPNPSYGAFRRVTISFDWANDEVDLLWEDVEGSSSDQTATGVPMKNGSSGIGRISWADDDTNSICGSNPARMGETWIDEIWGVYTGGTLTTATKTFSAEVKPNLSSLVYSLNGGSITLDVIASPGEAGEEIQSVTLDGETSYELTWDGGHTDFRVKMTFSSGRDTTPTMSAINLDSDGSGGGSGADSDQNDQTTWTIFGGEYDRSGNEYEGGGVITKYPG